MTDAIPEDVMKAAYQVIEFHRALDGSALKRGQGVATLIARAILVERERCAKVAETLQCAETVDEWSPDLETQEFIADAIRKGDTP